MSFSCLEVGKMLGCKIWLLQLSQMYLLKCDDGGGGGEEDHRDWH
jgi:hypothetical protein